MKIKKYIVRSLLISVLILPILFISSPKVLAACSNDMIERDVSTGVAVSSKIMLADKLNNGNGSNCYQTADTLAPDFNNIMTYLASPPEAAIALADMKAANGMIVGGYLHGDKNNASGHYLEIRDGAGNAVSLSDGTTRWTVGDGTGFNPVSFGRNPSSGGDVYGIEGIQGNTYYGDGIKARFANDYTSWVFIHLRRTSNTDLRKTYIMGGNKYIPDFLVMKACGNLVRTTISPKIDSNPISPNISITKSVVGDSVIDVKDGSNDKFVEFKIEIRNNGSDSPTVLIRDELGRRGASGGISGQKYDTPTNLSDNGAGGDFDIDSNFFTWEGPIDKDVTVKITYTAFLTDSMRISFRDMLTSSTATAIIGNQSRINLIFGHYHKGALEPGSGYTNLTSDALVTLKNTSPTAANLTCGLKVKPSSGTLPLTVNFEIDIEGENIDYSFDVDDGNGFSEWSDKNTLDYTYSEQGTYKTYGRIRAAGITEKPCEKSLDVTVNPWSDDEVIEIAP